MEFLDRYQQIVADAIAKYTFKDKPAELYEPMNYIISHGGKRLCPLMGLLACGLFGGGSEEALKLRLGQRFLPNFITSHR